jgi:hypothetical protein
MYFLHVNFAGNVMVLNNILPFLPFEAHFKITLLYHVLLIIFIFQIFPADVCVDILIEKLKSSRYVGDIFPSLILRWLIVLYINGSLVETMKQINTKHGTPRNFTIVMSFIFVLFLHTVHKSQLSANCTVYYFHSFFSSTCAQLLIQEALSAFVERSFPFCPWGGSFDSVDNRL